VLRDLLEGGRKQRTAPNITNVIYHWWLEFGLKVGF
jgi:hypothetical protein